jgi:hypothetical protein
VSSFTGSEGNAVLGVAVAGGGVHVAVEAGVDALRAFQVRRNVAQVGRRKRRYERSLWVTS